MKNNEIIQSFLGGRVAVLVGDITHQNVDAIVNAANWTLLGGGGVDGANTQGRRTGNLERVPGDS